MGSPAQEALPYELQQPLLNFVVCIKIKQLSPLLQGIPWIKVRNGLMVNTGILGWIPYAWALLQ